MTGFKPWTSGVGANHCHRFKFFLSISYAKEKDLLFWSQIGLNDNDVQRYAAASSIETDADVNVTFNVAQIELNGRQGDQRPLVDLNRNGKCFEKSGHVVNVATKSFSVLHSWTVIFASLSVVFWNVFASYRIRLCTRVDVSVATTTTTFQSWQRRELQSLAAARCHVTTTRTLKRTNM